MSFKLFISIILSQNALMAGATLPIPHNPNGALPTINFQKDQSLINT